MDNIIKAFSVGLLILLITVTQACATTVSIADATVEPDAVVTIPIMMSDITDYGVGTMNIEYDPSVVHVTGVTNGPDSQVVTKYINNTIGFVRILASNLYGASGDIIFANVVFTAVGTGSTPLDLYVETLGDTSYHEISPTIIDGSIEIEAPRPPTPFPIYGHVYYDNGTPCNNPRVNITNLNTGKEWAAGTSDNYYQIILTSGIDLNASEILRFDVTDGTNTDVTDHTITADDIVNGGLFDFNLTLESIDPAPYLITYTISNTTISPNGDGIMDDTEIDVEFSEMVDAAIKIENATGVVKTLYTSSDVKNPDPEIWDGTDDDGDIVAVGTYQVNVTMDDGVNPLVYDNSRSIMVTEGVITSVSITGVTVELGGVATIPIAINGITDYGSGTINITYNSSVVHVTDVTHSPDSAIAAFNSNNVIGYTAISASNFAGASGNIAFANVEFTAVGSSGDSTPLNLDVISLYDRSFNKIPVIISNGSFTIQSSADPTPHLVTYVISNTTISPNGDGIMDDTEIDVKFSEPVDAAITLENATGVIKTLYTGSGITDPDPQTWNGTDDIGDLVADGTYHVNVTMDDGVNPAVYDNSRSIRVANMSVATISIGNGSGIVTIPIAIEDGVNVGACDITLTYNASVVNVTGVTGGDMDVTIANLEHVHEGFVRIGAYQTSNPGLDGNITFVNVTFEPVGAIGDTCSLNLSVTTFKDETPVGNPMPYIVRNGTYCTLLNGDVNGDGVVDIHDAMYLAKHVLGESGYEWIIEEAADVNGDGEITSHDAMYLAKHVLKISGYEELR